MEEFQRVLRTRLTSTEEQVDFLTSHLEGAAKEEVRYRSPEEKNTPQKVLKILNEAFGEKATVSQLMAEFYQTKQQPNQSLRDFSHALMKNLDKVIRIEETFISDKDKLLRNQFSENVSDTWLKRELKKKIRAEQYSSFSDIREEAIVLSQDEDESNSRRRKENLNVYSAEATGSEALFSELRKEISSLRLEIQELRKEKSSKKEKVCYNCHNPGHFKRNCPETKNDHRLLRRADQ